MPLSLFTLALLLALVFAATDRSVRNRRSTNSSKTPLNSALSLVFLSSLVFVPVPVEWNTSLAFTNMSCIYSSSSSFSLAELITIRM